MYSNYFFRIIDNDGDGDFGDRVVLGGGRSGGGGGGGEMHPNWVGMASLQNRKKKKNARHLVRLL